MIMGDFLESFPLLPGFLDEPDRVIDRRHAGLKIEIPSPFEIVDRRRRRLQRHARGSMESWQVRAGVWDDLEITGFGKRGVIRWELSCHKALCPQSPVATKPPHENGWVGMPRRRS